MRLGDVVYLQGSPICDNFDEHTIKLNGGVLVTFYEWLHKQFGTKKHGMRKFLELGRVNLNLGLTGPAALCHMGFGLDEIQYSASVSLALDCQKKGAISGLEVVEYEYAAVVDGEKTIGNSLGWRFVERGVEREFIFDPLLRQKGAVYTILENKAACVPQLIPSDEDEGGEDTIEDAQAEEVDDDSIYVGEIETDDGEVTEALIVPAILKNAHLLCSNRGWSMTVGYFPTYYANAPLSLASHDEPDGRHECEVLEHAPVDLTILDDEKDKDAIPPVHDRVDITLYVLDEHWENGTLISTTILDFVVAFELSTFPDFLDCTSALSAAEFVQRLLADMGHQSRCALKLDKLPDEGTMREIVARFGDLFAMAVRHIIYYSEASPEYGEFVRSIGRHNAALSSR